MTSQQQTVFSSLRKMKQRVHYLWVWCLTSAGAAFIACLCFIHLSSALLFQGGPSYVLSQDLFPAFVKHLSNGRTSSLRAGVFPNTALYSQSTLTWFEVKYINCSVDFNEGELTTFAWIKSICDFRSNVCSSVHPSGPPSICHISF